MAISLQLDASDRRALRATARVCGLGVLAGLAGCAGAEAEAGLPPEVQVAPAGELDGPIAEVEPAPTPTPPPEIPVPRTEAQELQACREMTAAAPALKGERTLEDAKPPKEVLECCQRIADHYDSKNLEGMEAWTERYECCGALGWGGTMACTPWGPTAPPPANEQQAPVASEPQALDLRHNPELLAHAQRLGGSWSRAGLNDPQTLRAAQDTWRARMINEWVSARVFWEIADQMQAAGFSSAEVARWHEFGAQERRHGRSCGAVVQALGGDASAHIPALEGVPRHADVDPRQGVLRNVLSVSCMSETVAVALIGAERERMPDGPLRELLTQIYAQEVGHARAGWRLLREELSEAADPKGARRADLRAYLPAALQDLYAHELAHLPAAFVSPPQGDRWGLCSGAQARRLLSTTVRELIAPGLQQLLS